MKQKITGEMCVDVLKAHEPERLTAAEIAVHLGTDSRAVATALRKPVGDGRVHWGWVKGRGIASYKFKRLVSAKKGWRDD